MKWVRKAAIFVAILFVVFLVMIRPDMITAVVEAIKQFGQWMLGLWNGFKGLVRSFFS